MKNHLTYSTISFLSSIEDNIATDLYNAIKFEAQKNSRLAIDKIDADVFLLRTNEDKINCLKDAYEENLKKNKVSNWKVDVNNILSPSHYSHILKSVISGWIARFKESTVLSSGNSDQEEMLDFIHRYHEFIQDIISKLNSINAEIDTNKDFSQIVDWRENLFSWTSKEIMAYKEMYGSCGYYFDGEFDEEIENSFYFFSGYAHNLQINRKWNKESIAQELKRSYQQIVDFNILLTKCTDELIRKKKENLIHSIVPAIDKKELTLSLELAWTIEELKQKIISSESELKSNVKKTSMVSGKIFDTDSGSSTDLRLRYDCKKEEVRSYFERLSFSIDVKPILSREDVNYLLDAEFQKFENTSINRMIDIDCDKGIIRYFIYQFANKHTSRSDLPRYRDMIQRRFLAFKDDKPSTLTKSFSRKPEKYPPHLEDGNK
jgi:hypothetical protein